MKRNKEANQSIDHLGQRLRAKTVRYRLRRKSSKSMQNSGGKLYRKTESS